MKIQRPMMHLVAPVGITPFREALRKLSSAIDSVERTLEGVVAAKYENRRERPAGGADDEISRSSREWMLIG
jgi:hypothetical protein